MRARHTSNFSCRKRDITDMKCTKLTDHMYYSLQKVTAIKFTIASVLISVGYYDCYPVPLWVACDIDIQGRQTGGGVGGISTPPEFWMGGGLNTCQPPLILRRFILGGVGSP